MVGPLAGLPMTEVVEFADPPGVLGIQGYPRLVTAPVLLALMRRMHAKNSRGVL